MNIRIVFALLGLITYSRLAHAFIAKPSSQYPQGYQQPWANNYNYWGQPWGASRPLYLYPGLPFYGMMMPQQYPNYYTPVGISPYAPSPQCPTCNGTPYAQPIFN